MGLLLNILGFFFNKKEFRIAIKRNIRPLMDFETRNFMPINGVAFSSLFFIRVWVMIHGGSNNNVSKLFYHPHFLCMAR